MILLHIIMIIKILIKLNKDNNIIKKFIRLFKIYMVIINLFYQKDFKIIFNVNQVIFIKIMNVYNVQLVVMYVIHKIFVYNVYNNIF